MKTRIGAFLVPVLEAPAAVGLFPDGHYYAFWTAVFKKRIGKRWRVWGRARVGLSAGDRFDRMGRESRAAYIPKEDRQEYKRMWENMGRGANVKYVRPSTRAEVAKWLRTHPNQKGKGVRMK